MMQSDEQISTGAFDDDRIVSRPHGQQSRNMPESGQITCASCNGHASILHYIARNCRDGMKAALMLSEDVKLYLYLSNDACSRNHL